ncbi:serine hydrolase [Methylopila turkensis]|uniref:Penicillin-binding protein n=1 Tax=Methylopila turkensis TaxID=1437816 RepID=A0A9W6JR10_9HYPH|nr:serine hydrolase [Methylopila turkensis]GLK80789.1 penicillin-binding protein [Methylopila turkensis]
MTASCVTKWGGRALSCVLAAGVVFGAFAASVGDAEARSKRKVVKSKRPAIAARATPFTGGPTYAALVVDAKTGKVLFERNADARRFPASVTKVMTVYLMFEDLERGRVRLDTRLTMSAHCAAEAPSKLGMRPGQSLRVDDAIRALVTKSANDVACAVGENLEGSVLAFADRMTRKARALGMTDTVYRNASGLPNPAHVTTARDLVVLGRAVQDRFPRYYGYFGTRSFNFAGRTMPNHNRLLGRVEGVDGIKTGYTNASGFNLLTSVKSNGRSIVAVVMGGRTGAARDAHMRELIALNLPKASTGSRVAPLVAEVEERSPVRARPAVVAAAPIPLPTPAPALAPAEARVAAATDPVPLPAPAPAPVRVAQAAAVTPSAPRALAADVEPVIASTGPTRTPQPMRWVVGAPATTGSVAVDKPSTVAAYAAQPPREEPADIEGAPSVAPVAERQPVRKGWMIQIGATTAADAAQALLSDAKSKAGRALAAAEPYTEVYAKGDTTFYRARFAGLNERSADAACKALKRSSMSCFAIKN